MIVNFEIAMQINDMNQVINSFVQGINIISSQMKNITSSINLLKAQEAFEKAMSSNVNQYEALEVFISSAAESMKTMEFSGQTVNDSEIDQLITNQAIDTESDLDKEIDKKIGQIKEKMEAR
jgi:zinc transporter ZupT